MSDINIAYRKPLMPQLDDDQVTRLLLVSCLFMLANFVVFAPAWFLDPRVLDGASVWTKPQKFTVSLALHFATLAVLAQQLPREVRSGPVLIGFSYAAAVSLVFEWGYVSLQAARARRSHYNYDSQFEALMFALMGLGAFLLIAVAMALAVQIYRKGDKSMAGLRWGSILGLTLGFISTLIFAGYMSSYGRYVGGDLDHVGMVVPFFGWSREIGDLRPAHFVSLHLMQTLPLAGYIADLKRWPGVKLVVGVAIVQLMFATFLFVQALSGKPFWPV